MQQHLAGTVALGLHLTLAELERPTPEVAVAVFITLVQQVLGAQEVVVPEAQMERRVRVEAQTPGVVAVAVAQTAGIYQMAVQAAQALLLFPTLALRNGLLAAH